MKKKLSFLALVLLLAAVPALAANKQVANPFSLNVTPITDVSSNSINTAAVHIDVSPISAGQPFTITNDVGTMNSNEFQKTKIADTMANKNPIDARAAIAKNFTNNDASMSIGVLSASTANAATNKMTLNDTGDFNAPATIVTQICFNMDATDTPFDSATQVAMATNISSNAPIRAPQ